MISPDYPPKYFQLLGWPFASRFRTTSISAGLAFSLDHKKDFKEGVLDYSPRYAEIGCRTRTASLCLMRVAWLMQRHRSTCFNVFAGYCFPGFLLRSQQSATMVIEIA